MSFQNLISSSSLTASLVFLELAYHHDPLLGFSPAHGGYLVGTIIPNRRANTYLIINGNFL